MESYTRLTEQSYQREKNRRSISQVLDRKRRTSHCCSVYRFDSSNYYGCRGRAVGCTYWIDGKGQVNNGAAGIFFLLLTTVVGGLEKERGMLDLGGWCGVNLFWATQTQSI